MFDDLFELMKDGAFSSREEFDAFALEASREELFSLVKDGAFANLEEFNSMYGDDTLKKKDEPMESTSESGSSDSFEETPEDSFLNTPVTPPLEGEAVADAQAVNYGVPKDGQSGLDFDEEVAVKNARKRDAADTRSPYQRSGDILLNRENEQDNKFFSLGNRDFTYGSIAELETDNVIAEMKYHYGDYDFTFEHQTEWLGNEKGNVMLVTAPNGDTVEIKTQSIDGANVDLLESKKLKKFMDKHEPIKKTGLDRIEADAIENERKVLGKKDYDERMLDMQLDTRNLKDKLNAVVVRKKESDKVEEEFLAMSDEDFAENIGAYEAWKAEKDKISVDAEEVKIEWEGMAARGKELDRVVGDYTAMRAEGGNFFGGLVNEFWSSGFGRMFAAAKDSSINLMSTKMPAGYGDIWAKFQKGMLNGAMKDNPFSHAAREFIPQDRKGTSQLLRERGTAVAQAMGSGTSQEYVDDVGFVQGAIYGVGGSIPAMVTGLPGLVLQGIDFVNQETENNPNFEGISELEKFAMAAPMGIVMGWLEHLGLTRALAGKSGITTIVLKFLQKYKITPGTKTFTEYVDTEIKKGGNRLLLRLTASTMSEFETGGLQEMSDIAFKEVYNFMKKEEMFDTPETIGEGLSQVWWGAVAEAIGGFVMGAPGAVRSALTKGKITDLSDGEYEAFEKVMEDENLRGAYAEKLKQDVLSGKKSQQEALDEWNESEKVKGDMGRIPDYYTSEQKKKALELLIRKSELQDIVDKGEKQLVTKEQAEIDAIDAEMTAMSTETDTSSTAETDADGDTITNTVTVDEASAKIKLQEEGIKDPTQEQVDAKQAEMLEEGISQENLSAIDNLAKNTDSSGRLENRNKDLFGETQETSQGSAVLSDITESNENGVATGTYTNTETGDVDVVVSSKGKSDFVSFSRIYEDGKPTNSWSSKMINEAGSDFVTMLTEAQKLLPEGHQWTESKSISESGLGVWNKALKKGYEAQVDSEGNVITKSVTLNEAEKGKSTSDSSDFNDVIVETKSEADAKIKELEGIYPGIVAKPVRVRDGKGRIKGFSFKVELPVLVKGKTETKVEDTTTEEEKYQFGGRRKSEEDANRKVFEDDKTEKVEEKDVVEVDIDNARNGDVAAQEKLDKYGIKWEYAPTYRLVGESEVAALEKGETIEGKNKEFGVDVTTSNTESDGGATDSDYKVTFKKDGFDSKKKGSRVRMKNDKDGWVKGGYNKADVAKIEKKNEDGTYETVYDSEAEVEAEVEVDVATQIKNLQTEAKAFIAAEKSKASKGLPAYSKEFIQEDKKRRDEIKRLKGLIAKKTPKKKPAAKVIKKPAVKKAAPKKKAKVKSVQEEEGPKQRVVTPLQGESMQDAVRRTRVAKKATEAKKSTPKGLVYTGAFVNDTESLSKKYPSKLPNKEGSHMTVSFKPNALDVTTGKKTSLKVVGRLTTDKVDVLILENDKSTNATPHITLATAKGVSPATSNQEIKNNQDKIVPLDETVEATYGYFDSKAGNIISAKETKKAPVVKKAPEKKAPKPAPIELEEDTEDYSDEIIDIEMGIEDTETEINNVKSSLKEDIEEVKQKIAKVKKSKKSKDAKAEELEELKYEIVDLKEDAANLIEEYKSDISELKREKNKLIKKAKKEAEKAAEKKVVRTAKPRTKKEKEADNAEFIKIAGEPKSKKRAAWVKKQNKQNTRFRLKSKAESEVNQEEVSEVTEAIDAIESPNVDLELSFESSTPISLENLNDRTDSPLKSVTLKVVDGVPTIFTITDQLTTGNTTNPETGNPIDNLKGAIGFNGTKGNESFAWASVTEDKGNSIVSKALKVFNDNPELYYAWWEANKETNPDWYGLVPMNVVKMGTESIMSNEAVFRVLLDNIKSLPIKNRKAALKLLKQEIKTNLATFKDKAAAEIEKSKKISALTKTGIKHYNRLKDVIGKSKAVVLDDVLSEEILKQLALPQRKILLNSITYGSVNSPGKESVTPGKPSKAIPIALIEGQPIEDRRKVSLSVMTDLITDPELRDVPIGNIVALVGVDVLNPGIGKTTHPNYKFGINGRSMGILINPVPMQEAYPITYKKAFKKLMEKEEKGIAASSKGTLEAAANIGYGVPAKDYVGAVSDANSSDVNKLISFLNLSFPHVKISANSKEFNKILKTDGVKSYLKGGEVVYGVTTEGDVYINPDVHNSDSELFNTAIHEMSHVWTDYLETTPKGRAILAKGIELVKETDTYKEQLEEFDGDTEAAAREALSILIGNKGQTIVDGATKSKFKEWLLGMWNYIKTTFNVSKKTKVQDLTLNEFIEKALSDILGGKEIKTTPKQRAAMRSLSRFSKKGSTAKSDLTKLKNIVVKAIKDIRAQGKSEFVIKTLLENRGLEASLITELMAKEKGTTKTSVSPTEETNKGYNKLTSAIDAIIAKGYENGTSPVQIATEAISFLQDSKVYKSEKTEDIEREQMLRDLRKRFSMRETSAPSVKKILGEVTSKKISITEANLLKAQIKALNRGAKDMKSISDKASKVLAKEVKKLVKKGSITTNQSARILARFAKTDVTNDTQVNGFVDYITNIYNKSEDTYRNSLIVKIRKLIKKNTKVTRTAANRIKGKSLDAESQQFFAAMNRVLNRILETRKGKPVAVNPIEIAEDFFPDIEVILQKDPDTLTTKENSQLFAYMSFNSLEGIRTMTLEDVEQLLKDVKLGTKGGRSALQKKRMQEKAVIDELKAEANAAINEGYAELLNPDGTYKNVNLVNDRSDEAQRIKSRNRGVLDDIRTWKKNFIFTDLSSWINNLGGNLKNLATLTNSLDKEGDFFSKNVHKPLVKMETDTIKGIESEKINKLDEIAGSIEGVKNYKAILRLLSKGINSKVEGITDSDGNPYKNTSFPLDILLRWYALSKNKVQMDKLEKQGITKESIEKIKTELGPELVEFADKIIEYLSSPYFESINKVYKLVNNVNLVQIENYFPTQSVLQSVKSSLIESGDWNAVLAKMNESATKDRTNIKGDVLLTATDFTTALESHLEEMERYKAYAEGSLRLEKIFKFPSVNALLKTLGVMDSVKNAINFAINPDGGRSAIMSGPMDELMTKYTGFALATKFMQIGKQATSWIWSFEKYNFRGEGKTRVPGLDLTMYMVDSAKTLLTLPWQIRKAYKMSAVFRDRIRQAFEGDVRGLESGSRTAKEQRRTRKSIWKKFLKFLLGATTTAGDIVGVSGYMVTYNRDIQNGMDPEVALAKFEEYNTTQQSRMNVDKNPLQMNSNYAVRGFVMFGSSLFLQINKVMQNTTNIQRALRKFSKTKKAKDLPTQEMFRAMFLAAGVANVFFVAMANSFKYIQGGEDDREEVIQRMMDAMIGLNLIYQIPYLGSTVEEAVNKSRGLYRPGDSVVNPLTSFFRKFGRLQKKAEKKGNDSDLKTMENSLRLLLELNFGFQFDFFEGIYESFDGDFDDETMYKVLGVSSSYQPRDSEPDNINFEDKAPKISKEKNESDSFTNDGFEGGFEGGFEDDGF